MVPSAVACATVDDDDCLLGHGVRLLSDAGSADIDYAAGWRIVAACWLQDTGNVRVDVEARDLRAIPSSPAVAAPSAPSGHYLSSRCTARFASKLTCLAHTSVPCCVG
jgi:hypothetical protein